jgi:hypothetical protein
MDKVGGINNKKGREGEGDQNRKIIRGKRK